jgi:hypothetical protein
LAATDFLTEARLRGAKPKLAGLWGLTNHWATWDNENLLLLNPACLVLPTVWWRAPRIARSVVTLIAAGALISLIVRMLPGLYQGNLAFIALTVPVHLVLAVLAWRQFWMAGSAPTGMLARMSGTKSLESLRP